MPPWEAVTAPADTRLGYRVVRDGSQVFITPILLLDKGQRILELLAGKVQLALQTGNQLLRRVLGENAKTEVGSSTGSAQPGIVKPRGEGEVQARAFWLLGSILGILRLLERHIRPGKAQRGQVAKFIGYQARLISVERPLACGLGLVDT